MDKEQLQVRNLREYRQYLEDARVVEARTAERFAAALDRAVAALKEFNAVWKRTARE